MFMEYWGDKPLREANRLVHNYVSPFDSTSAINYLANPPIGVQIDYIFISSSAQALNLTKIQKSYDGIHTPSDHLPLLLECEFPQFKS